jgi:colanic acid/amylovoran biosynthesis glycosyltransferase
MTKLGILSPYLGAVSETFIRRHMEDLLPGKTVIIAGTKQPPYGGHWDVDVPKYMLPELKSLIDLSRKKKLLNLLRQAVRLKANNDLMFNGGLKDFLKENEVTTILGEYLHVSSTAINLANILNIKLYAHAHGLDISLKLQEFYWRKEYLNLNKIAGVITMSNYSKKILINLGIKKELIHIIPYGVNIPSLVLKKKEGFSIKCIAVGRMVAKKAPLLLLESFRKASEKNSKLTLDFVGAGKLFDAVAEYVKNFNLDKKVTLHKSMPNNEVHKLMENSDIFLQHSVTDPVTGDEEGLPVSILEAMAYNLPVVSTLHAGIPEAVFDNVNGFTVEEGDTKSMAEKIVRLAESEDLRTSMGNAGRKLAEERFSWEIEKKALLNLFKSTEN